jgi:hypothetical protein
MDPWLAFTLIQRTTALAYTSPFDAVEQNSARINGALGRFSIWTSFAYEAIGQISRQVGAADEARTWFRRSLDAARSAGLAGRVGRVQAMLENA